jgi:hypothetical protein
LLGLQSIETVANKPFFIGVLALLLEFKVHCYESDPGLDALFKKLKGLNIHIDLLKEISPLAYLQFTFITVVYRTICNYDLLPLLKELIDSFKLLKQITYLKKGYFTINIAFILTAIYAH